MKPRLRVKHGVWGCVSFRLGFFGFRETVIGYGYTFEEAYEDWKEQQ